MHDLITRAQGEGRNLLETEAMELLAAYGVPVVPARLAISKKDALTAATTIGYPVALKVVSPQVIHKSDVGGVAVNIRTPDELEHAYDSMLARVSQAVTSADIRGVLVGKMVAGSAEVIVGLFRDPQFGPVVMCGLGGVLVEIYQDVSLRLAPVNEVEALEMFAELKGAAILKGVRGKPPVDLGALAGIVTAVSRLAAACPEIKELDLNPVIASANGAVAVDARVLIL